jgi:hypothetical protein
MLAGGLFIAVQLLHPHDTLSSVTTDAWAIVHRMTIAMCILGLLGITGIYARQAEETGWFGLAGFLLLSLFYVSTMAFVFVETFILPVLATNEPKFVEGFLGLVTGTASEINLGPLPVLWLITGVMYMLGGLLFGIATLRARILPRWAAGLLAFGTVLPLLASSLLPHPYDRIFAVPVGVSLIWLGYALWSERREEASYSLPGSESAQLR